MLKFGDRIICADLDDMIITSSRLAKAGIKTDWLDIKEDGPEKFTLTVVGVEEEEEV